MKLSDYVAKRFADFGLTQVFMITGGGAMHLNNSFSSEPRLQCLFSHHEQASAMGAECYARVAGRPAILNVTTGPGGINAINGVFGAWTDSIPMIVVSGQVKRETCVTTCGLPNLRQLGDQEANIIRMVEGITKYSVLVSEPESIRYHIERAYFLATHGRPGPCWLDIPGDVQSARIEEEQLRAYDPAEDTLTWDRGTIAALCTQTIARIRSALRPVILAGTGVRLANAIPEFERIIRALKIPVTTGWTHDTIASDDELFCGRPGTIGERTGNFTVQNSDLLLVLGSRLNIRQVSYNWQSFARHAYKIQVDVDAAELDKPTVKPDLPIHCDLKFFLQVLEEQLQAMPTVSIAAHEEWRKWCRERVERYPVVQPKQRVLQQRANPYHFVEALSEALTAEDVVISGDATACIVPFQVLRIKKGQRLISNSGCASMGYDLPAAIGAAVARDGKRVICMAGDGSIQMNIQELQTIVHHQLPIKIFLIENNGYLSMRTSQSNFFGRLVGESPASGVSFPDMVKIATAYGIPATRIENAGAFDRIHDVLEASGPSLCVVEVDPAQEFEPRMKSRQLPDGTMVTPVLEDMYPFLSPEELRENLLFEE